MSRNPLLARDVAGAAIAVLTHQLPSTLSTIEQGYVLRSKMVRFGTKVI